MVLTKTYIPGIALIVLSGLRILITLMADMFELSNPTLTRLRFTTMKSI